MFKIIMVVGVLPAEILIFIDKSIERQIIIETPYLTIIDIDHIFLFMNIRITHNYDFVVMPWSICEYSHFRYLLGIE